jgi:sulfoxide reductase heme-binding subunit YedZ
MSMNAMRQALTGSGPRPKILWAKIMMWALGAGIGARLAWLVASDGAGANPVEFLQTHTGWQAIAWLLATLLCTPVSRLGKLGWLAATRRVLGLWAFAFASAHLGIYILDQGIEWGDIVMDVYKRPFIAAGFAGWLALVPLAATSNLWSMRKLGKRWRQLHKASYFVAAAGMLHWYWMRAPKHKLSEWSIFAGLFVVWAVWRLALAKRAQISKMFKK